MRNAILTLLVLTVAFLTASFPARNSDFWFHLATGRLLAQRQFSFGTDPFCYTTQHIYWACHAWLFDLVLYGLRSWIGDAGLVALKALVVAALAGLLLRIRRPGSSTALPAVCTTLAILAISPRLLLQPTCLSYFFLGLTLWLLWRPQLHASQRFWPLLLVFVLWVNVDEWFLLGPLLVALFWLGERLQPADIAGDGPRRTPGWIVPAGFAVCLINPYTYHAFTLPAELSSVPWTSGLREDERFRAFFAWPWDAEHWHAALRLNAAVLAYYVLTLLGLASFLLHWPALRDGRLLVWLPFAVLAAWQARLIPFFAVVAAPITALNWQDIVKARSVGPGPRGRFVFGASLLAVVLSLMSIIALTWLGWPTRYDRVERHVAWGVQEDPSLRQTVATLEYWRRHGLLPDEERIFALAPEAAHYGAWFCPGERQFFDHRYPLFPVAAREYETVCRTLLPSRTAPQENRTADWQRVLQEHKVSIVVFYDRDPQRVLTVLHRLSNEPEQWTLLHLAGQALIVGWNKARPSGGFDSLAFDADRLAYGLRDAKTQCEAPSAPERGPDQLPSHRGLWASLTRSPAPQSWESAAATTYLHYFHDGEAAQRQQKWQLLLPAYTASLAGLPAQPSAIPQAACQLRSSWELLFPSDLRPQYLVRGQLGPFFASLVERAPALPLLAIRAARRSVAANPEDANAWLRLGQAYLLLRDLTSEHSVQPEQLPPLTQLRHVQIAAALEQAVRLDPDLEAAHRELAFLYGAANALEQSLVHRLAEVRLSRRAGARPGESTDEFAYRMELLELDTAKVVKQIQNNRQQYNSAANSIQGDLLAKARLAVRLGLDRQAVEEVLLSTPADLLRPAGIRLELELLLSLGRLQEVRDILNSKTVRANKHGLGYSEEYGGPSYEWLHMLAAAAAGDYVQGREDLRTIRAVKHAQHERLRQQASAFERALLPSLLAGAPPFLPAFAAGELGRAWEQRRMQDQTLRAQQADLCVLEGILALEQGDTKEARSVFAQADELADTVPFAGRPIATEYLSKLRAYQSDKSEPRP
jgi:hypothetical protein